LWVLEDRLGLLIVEVVVFKALEVGLDHIALSVMLGLKPQRPQRGINGICRILK
jgi:hypothetical protein